MARVQVTTRALADLERLFDFLAERSPKLARERMVSVRRAFELLADHPLLGREAEDGRRELILARGRFGYVAKYRWLPDENLGLILAVRHQQPMQAIASVSFEFRKWQPGASSRYPKTEFSTDSFQDFQPTYKSKTCHWWSDDESSVSA